MTVPATRHPPGSPSTPRIRWASPDQDPDPADEDGVVYPTSDGAPLGETESHIFELFGLIDRLGRHLAPRRIHVGSNLFFYYQQGDPKACFAPDFFALADTDPDVRLQSYKFWHHDNRPPIFILEATSDETRHRDLTDKRTLYRRLGVAEYFLYDPIGGQLNPRLQGFRLRANRYRPVAQTSDGGLLSEGLGVVFRMSARRLELTDRVTGQPLLSGDEEHAARLHAEARIAALEAENARLRAAVPPATPRFRKGEPRP